MKGQLDLPVLIEIGKKYGKTPAQVVGVNHGTREGTDYDLPPC